MNNQLENLPHKLKLIFNKVTKQYPRNTALSRKILECELLDELRRIEDCCMWIVVCDERNNPPSVVESDSIVADVWYTGHTSSKYNHIQLDNEDE